MNKQQLAAKIWESANKMRSKIEANEYKDYILGFMFYKFLSEKEVKYLKSTGWTDEYLPEVNESDHEVATSVKKNIGYFISYENLFSTWINKGRDFSVQNVTVALNAFNRNINSSHKSVFEGIFETLQTGLSKLGETDASRSKSISELIHLIKDIPMDGKQDYDELGFIYEYNSFSISFLISSRFLGSILLDPTSSVNIISKYTPNDSFTLKYLSLLSRLYFNTAIADIN